MRELEFRAWNGGVMNHSNTQSLESFFSQNNKDYDDVVFMQYTNLKDSKKNKIFDKDIIKMWGRLFVVEIDEYGVVLYGNGKKDYWNRIIPEKYMGIEHITQYLSIDCEVVGNTCQNEIEGSC